MHISSALVELKKMSGLGTRICHFAILLHVLYIVNVKLILMQVSWSILVRRSSWRGGEGSFCKVLPKSKLCLRAAKGILIFWFFNYYIEHIRNYNFALSLFVGTAGQRYPYSQRLCCLLAWAFHLNRTAQTRYLRRHDRGIVFKISFCSWEMYI